MPDLPQYLVHTGPSMNPTLRPGDQLLVVPYDGRKVRCGDVIVFRGPGGGQPITHRVICVDSHGIRVRGDNNRDVDPWILSPENILGRVVYAKGKTRRRRVFGGLMGRLFCVLVRSMHFLDSRTSCLLRPTYHRLVQKGFVRQFLSARLQTRVVSFGRTEGSELHLMMGRLLIGRRRPGDTQWHIRRPFRLLVDETRLPE